MEIRAIFYLILGGLTQKQQELKELKEKIVELKQQGLSNRAIAKELNCSEGKIRSILKK